MLRRHIQKHAPDHEVDSCKQCIPIRHLKWDHKERKPLTEICHVCQKECKNRTVLRSHMSSHRDVHDLNTCPNATCAIIRHYKKKATSSSSYGHKMSWSERKRRMEEASNPATTAAAGSGRDAKSPHMGTWSTKQQNGLIGDMGYPSTSGTTDVIFVVEDEATDAAVPVPGSFTASHPHDEDDEEIERFEVDVALGRVTRM